jgi:hypothetical protein
MVFYNLVEKYVLKNALINYSPFIYDDRRKVIAQNKRAQALTDAPNIQTPFHP